LQEKWWEHDQAWERYNYLYNNEQLEGWVASVRELESQTEHTFVFFNNHYGGNAVKNAKLLKRILANLK